MFRSVIKRVLNLGDTSSLYKKFYKEFWFVNMNTFQVLGSNNKQLQELEKVFRISCP